MVTINRNINPVVLFTIFLLLGFPMVVSMGNAQNPTTERNEIGNNDEGAVVSKKIADLMEIKTYLRNNRSKEERYLQTQAEITKVAGIKNDHDDDKVCVIHVGPHKTGSSSLQNFLIADDESQDALKRDNYKVPFFSIGNHFRNKSTKYQNHALLGWCVRVDGDNRPIYSTWCPTESFRRDIFSYLQSFVNDAALKGSNILLSSEELARFDVDITELMSFFTSQYKIHIVMYYRRFYDWIHSMYNQIMKNVPDHSAVTFVEWLTKDTLDYYNQVSAISVYSRYEKAPGVFNISVVNMHEDPDNFNTNERFACKHLDKAPHLCELSKSDRIYQTNPSRDLNWEIFRARVGLYHSIRLLANDIRWGLIEEKFRLMTDIPKLCLSPNLKDTILEMSLESEIALTAEQWYSSEEGLDDLKTDFQEKSNSKLCSMDIDAILNSAEWQSFLTKLEANQIKEGS